MHGVLDHARRNVVAWVALFVAVGGTSYAAVAISNHSITPVKLNPSYIGGYARAWISVNANGRVAASAGGVRVLPDPNVAPGHYIVDWHPRPTSRCTAIGSVDLSDGLIPGYVTAETAASPGRGEQSAVQTFNPQGQPAALPYDLELLCATPR